MAVDTRNRRFSITLLGFLAPLALANPDSDIASAERAQLRALYAGLELHDGVWIAVNEDTGAWVNVTADSGAWSNVAADSGVWTSV